jgi:hypothetical protein
MNKSILRYTVISPTSYILIVRSMSLNDWSYIWMFKCNLTTMIRDYWRIDLGLCPLHIQRHQALGNKLHLNIVMAIIAFILFYIYPLAYIVYSFIFFTYHKRKFLFVDLLVSDKYLQQKKKNYCKHLNIEMFLGLLKYNLRFNLKIGACGVWISHKVNFSSIIILRPSKIIALFPTSSFTWGW